MQVVIVDCGIANFGSMHNMFRKIGVDASIARDGRTIAAASHLVLPGIGSFDSGMARLKEGGTIDLLHERVLGDRVPVLGVCLGMQLLTRRSEEGRSEGLGWIDAEVQRFELPTQAGYPEIRVPHMGWNEVEASRSDPLFVGFPRTPRFYFAHSYHLRGVAGPDVVAITRHGYAFPSVVRRENIIGAQFHPEKSHRFGMTFLANFLRAYPC